MPDSGSFPGTILQEFIAVGRPNRPGRAIHPTSITMHNTSNTSPGADAKAHSRFVRNTGHYVLRSGRKNWVSWHYTVDDNVAIQHLPNTEMGWHAGPANGSSIGIEVCMHQGINRDLADRRAAALVAKLLRDLGLTRNDIKTHKDWTRKDCPTLLLPQWQAFLALVDDARNALPPPPMAVAPAASRRAVEKAPRLAKKDLGEIDHHLMAIPDELLSSAAASAEDGLVKASLATVFDQLTALTANPRAARVLFPNGIDHIDLHVKLPTEFRLVLSGPKSASAPLAGPVAAPDDEIPEYLRDIPGADSVPEDEEDLAAAATEPVNQQLVLPAMGLYGYGNPARRFGIKRTIDALMQVGAAFTAAHGGVRLGIGDISKLNGGAIGGHASHQRGIDVDIRPLRNDGKEEPITFQSTKYSRTLTQALVHALRANTIIPVKSILFNDTEVQGVSSFAGHDNHLHVRFKI